MSRPKPVRDVKTFDGRLHEVDIRQRAETFTAWGFVDQRLIEGQSASKIVNAIANWKKEYETTFRTA